MARKMIVRPNGGQAGAVLEQVPAESEAQLQGMLRDHPDLLPLEDLDLEGPLLVVGKETWLASGAVDLVGLAKSGELVLVEFKTGPQNPDFRHALAQLVDYGSDLWGMDFERFERLAATYFTSEQCTDERYRRKTSLWAAAKVAWPDMEDEKNWNPAKDKLTQQLRDGEMAYVLAAQRFTASMERGIHYMNHVSKGPRFYAAEFIRFLGGDKEAFECRVVVRPEQGSGPTNAAGWEELMEDVSDDRYREALGSLRDHAQNLHLTVYKGTVGFSVRVKTSSGPISIAWLYPPGKAGWMGLTDLTLGYDLASEYPQSLINAISEEKRENFKEYARKVSSLPGAEKAKPASINGVKLSPECLTDALDGVRDAWTTLVQSVGEG